MMELSSDLDLPRNSGSVDDLVLIRLERAGTRDAGITLRTALFLNGKKFELILHSCEKKMEVLWRGYNQVRETEICIFYERAHSVFNL